MEQPIPPAHQGKLVLSSGRKWFWIAVLITGPLASITGLLIGIGLLGEPEQRKAGWLLIAWAIVWNIIVYFTLSWLIQQGYLPKYQPVYR